MTSQIDPKQPTTTHAYTNEVRDNFQHMKDEIEELQNAVAAFLDGTSRTHSRAAVAHMMRGLM